MTAVQFGCPGCGLELGPRTIDTPTSVTCPRCFTLYIKQIDGTGVRPADLESQRAEPLENAGDALVALRKSLLTTEWPLTVGRLAKLNEVCGDVVGGLLGMLDDANPRIILGAAFAARTLVDQLERIGPALLALLAHPHGLVRATARWSLRAFGPSAVELMNDHLGRGKLRAPIAEALAFLGCRAESGLPSLRYALDCCAAEEAETIRDAISTIAGPWNADPGTAIPYLGEAVIFDEEEPEPIDEELLWVEIVEGCAHGLSDEADIYTLEGWKQQEQSATATMQWTPDQIVLGRPTVVLETYNFRRDESDPMTTRVEVTAADRRGFTMGELMQHAITVYATHPDWGTRIFEGLKREEPGVYYINTGS